jgi:hypothetical protein
MNRHRQELVKKLKEQANIYSAELSLALKSAESTHAAELYQTKLSTEIHHK